MEQRLKENLESKVKLVQRLIKTPDGQRLFEVLESEFNHDNILSETPDKTAYKLGQRDVWVYLNQLARYKIKR